MLKSDKRSDHIPIIILTAKTTMQDRIEGWNRGADAYLTKPFEKAELFTRLDHLVESRRKLIQKWNSNGVIQILTKNSDDPNTRFIRSVVKVIHNELENDHFGSPHLVRQVRLSESQLYRKLKTITGKSTALFIRSVRLQYAHEMILSTDKNISEVAYATGFNNPAWFSRAFREEFGYSPSELRK